MRALYVLMGYSLLWYFGVRNRTRVLIAQLGIVEKYYPKRYVAPGKAIAKHFGIIREKIPWFIYIELYTGFLFVFLCPVYVVITLLTPKNQIYTAGVCCLFHVVLLFLDFVFFLITSLIWQQAAKKDYAERINKKRLK